MRCAGNEVVDETRTQAGVKMGRIPNIEYLGACYNAVTMDPQHLASSVLGHSVFDLSQTSSVTTSIGAFEVPNGVTHHMILNERYDSVSGVASSVNEFQDTFKQNIEIKVGVKGAFEFTGSRTYKEIKKETASRKHSFVYARAIVEIHSVWIDPADEGAKLKLDRPFRDEVAKLPASSSENPVGLWKDFIDRFGTHFAWNITIGGMATQRTTGLASEFLKSEETEEQLKAKGKLVISKVTAGASVDQAHASVSSADVKDKLDRARLDIQGGVGGLGGINEAWRKSLPGEPTIISAKLKRIDELLTRSLFPDDTAIEMKRIMLGYAIDHYILEKGEPALVDAPLEYGDSLLLVLPWSDDTTVWPPVVSLHQDGSPGELQWLVDNKGAPVTSSPQPANFIIENADGSRGKRPILAGDEVFLKHASSGSFLKPGPGQSPIATFTRNKNDASRCIILHAGDNARSPARLGEYFAETDLITFAKAPLGSSGDGLGVMASGRYLSVGTAPAGFKLMRWDPAALEADDDDDD
jgi:hypothetical protein